MKKKNKKWISVWDDIPEILPGWNRCTRNVEILLESGETFIGYFDYGDYVWRDDESKKIKKPVKAWRDL